MVARFAGASLGLLAFTVAVVCGLIVRNPVTVTLSRGILALFVFCLIGMVLGAIAQMVITEHEKRTLSRLDEQYPQQAKGEGTTRKDSGSPAPPGRSAAA